jgi:hypothetical protein
VLCPRRVRKPALDDLRHITYNCLVEPVWRDDLWIGFRIASGVLRPKPRSSSGFCRAQTRGELLPLGPLACVCARREEYRS